LDATINIYPLSYDGFMQVGSNTALSTEEATPDNDIRITIVNNSLF
jgi:hypothetical protein